MQSHKLPHLYTKDEYERIGKIILDCAYEVYKELGTGLLESIYEECLLEELKTKRLFVENQVYLPVYYKGKKLDKSFRIDILVEDIIVVELKSQLGIYDIDEAQLVSYMKLSNKKLGYLINFNEALLKNGIRRKVNNYFN
ncbi:MAG: GxxExxY protein [Prevotellaceae bacterium]|jgi:GxxExxY protein|nr:GxxExxY protein [Prevotellaceae bacterium]